MFCPLCADETLKPVVRHRVELDFCPRCKGVWLDRGELESLIDFADGAGPTYVRSGPAPAASAPPPPRDPERSKRRDDDDDDDDDDDHERRSRHRRRKKRKSKFSDLLDDVFDFDFD